MRPLREFLPDARLYPVRYYCLLLLCHFPDRPTDRLITFQLLVHINGETNRSLQVKMSSSIDHSSVRWHGTHPCRSSRAIKRPLSHHLNTCTHTYQHPQKTSKRKRQMTTAGAAFLGIFFGALIALVAVSVGPALRRRWAERGGRAYSDSLDREGGGIEAPGAAGGGSV